MGTRRNENVSVVITSWPLGSRCPNVSCWCWVSKYQESNHGRKSYTRLGSSAHIDLAGSTTDSRRDAAIELIGGRPVPVVGALELRLEWRLDPVRGGTLTDPDFPLIRCPLSTLSWIISSSILDISSTDFLLKSGTPLRGESSPTGVIADVGDLGPATLSWFDVALLPEVLLRCPISDLLILNSADDDSGVSSAISRLRTAERKAATVRSRSMILASLSSSFFIMSSPSPGPLLNAIETRE